MPLLRNDYLPAVLLPPDCAKSCLLRRKHEQLAGLVVCAAGQSFRQARPVLPPGSTDSFAVPGNVTPGTLRHTMRSGSLSECH